MACNYPIKFEPILLEKIWGGTKLNQFFNKKSTAPNVGESWEISTVPNAVSVVVNGALEGQNLLELIKAYQGELLGDKVYRVFGNEFPLLIKFIDAKTDLSIQLHPDDVLAKKRHNSFGKTEMWYVLQADKNAKLIVGFNQPVDKTLYLEKLAQDELLSILNAETVTAGDVFFIPTGRIHAIGGGVLVAEIQQTSDITYRVFDWNRVDSQGKGRELHTELALEALDFSHQNTYKIQYDEKRNEVQLASCPYFTTKLIAVANTLSKINDKDSFVIYMCVAGAVSIQYESGEDVLLKTGETVLLPATLKNYTIIAEEKAKLLEVFID